MTDIDEYESHRNSNCEIYPMQYEYKYTRKKRGYYMAKNVKNLLKDMNSNYVEEEKMRMERLKKYTIPSGHVLLDGTLDELKRVRGELD